MRAVQSLKIFNRESDRESQWLNRYADIVNANVRLGRTKIAFTSINDALFGLENIITIYLAARLALSNSLTIGMVFAFISYKQDNICFFDSSFDQERMIHCARLAGIHEEIMAMPMTYNSLVGDMGSSLSGGQKPIGGFS